MEYGFALVIPKGYENDIAVITMRLIKEGIDNGLTSRISILEYDKKPALLTFSKGKDASAILQTITRVHNKNKELDYVDDVHVSSNSEEAINMLCKYINLDVDRFDEIEKELFDVEPGLLASYDFASARELYKRTSKNRSKR